MTAVRISQGILVFSLTCLLSASAAAQSTPPLAWQKQFEGDIDWYVRTSAGVLLVRAANTIFALDGQDGRELWSMKGLDTRGPRGRNLLEIPGTPFLLAKRARPDHPQGLGALLLINLWSGKNQMLELNVEELVHAIPFYDRERLLLVTGPANPALVHSPRFQWRPLFDHHYEKSDWKTKYPAGFGGPGMRFAGFYLVEGQLYLYLVGSGVGFEVSRVELGKGKRAWKFGKGFRAGSLVPPRLVADKLLVAGTEIFVLDATTGKQTSSVKGLGKVVGWFQQGSVILGLAEKAAFPLDGATENFRWRLDIKKDTSNPLFYEEQNLLLFAQEPEPKAEHKSELVVVEAASGQVRRRVPLPFQHDVLFIRKIGRNFLYLNTGQEVGLYDLATDTVLWTDEPPDAAFEAVSFLTAHPIPKVGAFVLGDLRKERPGVGSIIAALAVSIAHRYATGMSTMPQAENATLILPEATEERRYRLEKGWEQLQQRASQDTDWQKALERLEPFLMASELEIAAYATERKEGQWKLWRIDPVSGARQAWILSGEQPDLIPAFGLAYTFKGKTLRAFRLASP